MQTFQHKNDPLLFQSFASFMDRQNECTDVTDSIAAQRLKPILASTNSTAWAIHPGNLSPERLQLEASRVLSLLSGKWTCDLLWILGEGTIRLSQLQRRMPGVSKKVLIEELRKLEDCGLLLRTDLSSHHRKHVEYSLIDDIRPGVRHLFEALALWGLTLRGYSSGDLDKRKCLADSWDHICICPMTKNE